MRLVTPSITTNKNLTKRLVIGFAALAGAAVIGTAGMAQALTQVNSSGNAYNGGGTQINTSVDVDANTHVDGNHNVVYNAVNVVLNYFSGNN